MVCGPVFAFKRCVCRPPGACGDCNEKLVDINRILAPLGAHIGYRVRDEICFYLAYNEEGQFMEFQQAFDYCLMQKFCRASREATDA